MRVLILICIAIALGGNCGAGVHQQRMRPARSRAVDGRILAFVAYLSRHGIRLAQKEPREPNSWQVVKPTSTPYKYWVTLRAFPAEQTAEQMNAEERRIQLHFHLNYAAHLGIAISVMARNPRDLPAVSSNTLPTGRRLLRLFDSYRPRHSVPAPAGRTHVSSP